MKKTKKLLALFVSLCMVLSMLPVTALAVETKGIESLKVGEAATTDKSTGEGTSAEDPKQYEVELNNKELAGKTVTFTIATGDSVKWINEADGNNLDSTGTDITFSSESVSITPVDFTNPPYFKVGNGDFTYYKLSAIKTYTVTLGGDGVEWYTDESATNQKVTSIELKDTDSEGKTVYFKAATGYKQLTDTPTVTGAEATSGKVTTETVTKQTDGVYKVTIKSTGLDNDDTTLSVTATKKSSEKKLLSLSVAEQAVTVSAVQGTGAIDSPESLSVEVPFGTELNNAAVTATVSAGVSSVSYVTEKPEGSFTGTQLGEASNWTKNIDLSGGKKLYLEVTAEDGTKAYYELTITVAKGDSTAELTSITVDNATENPSKPTNSNTSSENPEALSATIPYNAEEQTVTVKVTTTDTATAYWGTTAGSESQKIDGGQFTTTSEKVSSEKPLDLYIKVTAQDGETSHYYKLTISMEKASSEAKITNVQIAEPSAQKAVSEAGGADKNSATSIEITGIEWQGTTTGKTVTLTLSKDATAKYAETDGEVPSSDISNVYSGSLTADLSKTYYIEVTAQDGTKAYYKLSFKMDAPTVTLTGSTSMKVGSEGEKTVTITISEPSGLKFASESPNSGLFTLTGAASEGLSVESVSSTGPSQEATVTLNAAPTVAGDLTIEVAKTAFATEAAADVSVTVQVAPGEAVDTPTVTVAPTSINAGTKNPTVTLTCEDLNFTNETPANYEITGASGLSVESVTANGHTATLKLTGTVKGTELTITVKPDAFGGSLFATNNATTKITVNKVTPKITVSPTTINVGTAASEIKLTVTSDIDFKSSEVTTANITVECGETGLTAQVAAGSNANEATITFTSEEAAKAGTIKITAKASAYDSDIVGENGSNTVTVTVSTPSSGSTTPSTSVDDPATDTTTGETTVDVNTGSTLSGTTANATVSGANMDKAVESAVTEAAEQDTAPVVEVNVDTSSRADGINVTLPADSLDKLAQAEGSSLKITSDVAEVEMDNTALAALAEQADTTAVLSVTPAKDMNEAQTEAAGTAPVVDVTVTSGGKTITDYHGGILLITLPYKLPAGHDEASVVVFYLDDAGKLTACATSYKDNKVTFLTKHLSKYVIGSTDMNEVTLTATTTLAASVSGGEIVLTATGSAFAEAAAAASFTLSDTNLTVSAVKVSGATATLTVTGTPTAAGPLTVTAKKDAFDPAAAADATATVTVAEAAPAPTPTTVTLTATSTLAVGVNGGTITLTTDGAAFADPAVATNFTLSDTTLTVTGVVVKDKTATLTVTGTPAESETVTVTVKKEAFAAAEADASVKLSVSLFTFDFTFETSMVEGKLVLTVGIEVYLRGNLLLTIPVEIPLR